MAAKRFERIRKLLQSDRRRSGAASSGRPVSSGPPAPHAYNLTPGEVVAGRYLVTREIGHGGMGEVYEVRDQLLNETVALKTLRAELARDEGVVKRFQREIQLARRVTHHNVCRIFEMGLHRPAAADCPALPFFTMELLEGETLFALIRARQRMSRAEAFPIAVQMAEGLQAAHDAGVVHADFKSGNVLLIRGKRGIRAVITDFGLARIDPTSAPPDETRTMNAEGAFAGTVAYMSPEQMTGGSLTAASDIYSFGIVLFEMATGEMPFDTRHAILAAVQKASGEPITARSLVADLDSKWDSAIGRCLQPEPDRRFSSAGELAECFRTPSWRVPRAYWGRREWTVAVLATLAAVGLPAGAWIWTHRPYQPKAEALAWYQKGVAALHSMTYEAARRTFEQAVTEDPGFALAHAGLARAYEELDYSDMAKDAMLRAVAAAQESRLGGDDRQRLLAMQFLVSHDYDRAAPLFRKLEESAALRDKPAAALETGWLAQQRDQTDAAAAAYERALKLDPTYAAAKLRLAYIRGRQRQVDAALKAYQEAEALYRASSNLEGVSETLLQRAQLLSRSSRWAEAMPVIEQALEVARAVASPYQQIRLELAEATAARNLGDRARAASLVRDAIDAAIDQKMENLATAALLDQGGLAQLRGDLAGAEASYRRALDLATRAKVRRNEARARLSLGSLCEQQRRPEESRKFVEASLPFFRQAGYRREYIQALTILGGVRGQLGNYEDSVTVLREALAAAVQIQDTRTEGNIQERLGESLRDQTLWPEAAGHFERAASLLGPKEGAESKINCADLYWRLGRREDAVRTFAEAEAAIEKSGNRPMLAELRLRQTGMAYQEGRMPEAASLAGQAPADSPDARLMVALIAIRARPANADPEAANAAIASLERGGRLLDAAWARLLAAEALLAASNPSPAARGAAAGLAGDALKYFEPRHIWEGSWRAHGAAFRASPQGDAAEAHRSAARSAIDQLRAQWSPETVGVYLRRPEIISLSNGLR
jgi:tetratricopeptide (TPR) repeat protein